MPSTPKDVPTKVLTDLLNTAATVLATTDAPLAERVRLATTDELLAEIRTTKSGAVKGYFQKATEKGSTDVEKATAIINAAIVVNQYYLDLE